MAKELPYFKFEPNQWENGLIQMCNRESKGLFIDIISIYWQRLGNLPYRYVLQRLCNGNANALQELCDEGIIKVKNDNIHIDFLDDQLNEFKDKSKSAKKSADERWRKQREKQEKDANAMRTHSEGNAIREDKIILDNSSSINNNHDYYLKECLNSHVWIENVCINTKLTKEQIPHALKDFNSHLIADGENKMNLRDYKSHFVRWVRKLKQK